MAEKNPQAESHLVPLGPLAPGQRWSVCRRDGERLDWVLFRHERCDLHGDELREEKRRDPCLILRRLQGAALGAAYLYALVIPLVEQLPRLLGQFIFRREDVKRQQAWRSPGPCSSYMMYDLSLIHISEP